MTLAKQQSTDVKKGCSTQFLVGMTFLVIIGAVNSSYILQIIPHTKEFKPYDDFTIKDFSSFWVTAVGSAVLMALQYLYETFTKDFWLRIARKQHDPVLKAKYAKKALRSSFQLAWYVFIVAYGFGVIKDTPCHHFWIGGAQSDQKGLYEGMPFHDDPEIFMYCLISHSYHFMHLIETLFINERQNDYEQLLIHHTATNILLFNSNLGSCHRYGAVILFIHDVSEVFLKIARTLDSMEGYDAYSFFLGFLPMIITWVWFRLLYFPWIIYGLLFEGHYPENLSFLNSYLWTQAFFMGCLLVLHVIWFKSMLRIGYTFLSTGVGSDKVNDLQTSSKTQSSSEISQKSLPKMQQDHPLKLE